MSIVLQHFKTSFSINCIFLASLNSDHDLEDDHTTSSKHLDTGNEKSSVEAERENVVAKLEMQKKV